jgi:hypothetical protein
LLIDRKFQRSAQHAVYFQGKYVHRVIAFEHRITAFKNYLSRQNYRIPGYLDFLREIQSVSELHSAHLSLSEDTGLLHFGNLREFYFQRFGPALLKQVIRFKWHAFCEKQASLKSIFGAWAPENGHTLRRRPNGRRAGMLAMLILVLMA